MELNTKHLENSENFMEVLQDNLKMILLMEMQNSLHIKMCILIPHWI